MYVSSRLVFPVPVSEIITLISPFDIGQLKGSRNLAEKRLVVILSTSLYDMIYMAIVINLYLSIYRDVTCHLSLYDDLTLSRQVTVTSDRYSI